MATTTTQASRAISKENKPDHPVIQQLQQQVANGFVLYLNYKHYHWQTFGPLFRDIHLMFDEMAHEVLESIDPLAERVRMLGPDVNPIQLKQMQEAANVRSTNGADSLREMVEEADANLMLVIRDMREGAKRAEDSNDPGTVDLFSKTVQIHEKHEWFLRELLKKRDGLVT